MPSERESILRLCALPIEELRARARIPFRLVADTRAVVADFAEAVLDEVRRRSRNGEPTRLILPIGPVAQYQVIAEASNREGLSWKRVHIFGMDEFLDWQGRPLPAGHPLGFENCLRRELVGRLDPGLRIPDDQVVFPHPFRIDEISRRIAEVGGVDLCCGGIGYHGHVAFNEPPLSRWYRISPEELRASLTRVVTLGEDSIVIQSIASAGGCCAAIPPMAVTLGLRDILAAGRIRLYLTGGERHRAVFRLSVAGEVTSDYPATLIQGHSDAEVITDVATATPIEIGIR